MKEKFCRLQPRSDSQTSGLAADSWPCYVLLCCILATGLVLTASPGHAQPSNTPLANFWIANNQVNAIVETNGIVFLGGSFNYVGPNTGPGGVVNATNGTPDLGWPRVRGSEGVASGFHSVNKVIPDGAGGWYVAGMFTYVGALQRQGVVHLLGNKTVDTSFNANVSQVDNDVNTVALAGNTLYLGSTF